MRKIVATLAVLSAVAGLGTATGTAAADVPADVTQFTVNGLPGIKCSTDPGFGVFSYSVMGYYHDGCTAKLRCARAYCTFASLTWTNRAPYYGGIEGDTTMVSQNARLRVFPAGSPNIENWHHDTSCYRPGGCRTTDLVMVPYGSGVTIQCNSVTWSRELVALFNTCQLTQTA